MNVVIVEDEPYAQNELKRLLSKLERDIQVLECIDSVEDTVDWIKNNPLPDLMFFDIQLSDGLSFEIFNKVEVNTSVIFTTAFDEYAIDAFKVNSIDYLLKPIKLDDLDKAVEKYYKIQKQFEKSTAGLQIEQIEKLIRIHKPKYKSRFVIKIGDQIKYTEVNEVAYFIAEDNEVMLVTKKNNRYIIDFTLDQLTDLLDPDEFFRINRSYIVTLSAISKISKYFNSRLNIELVPASDDTVLISRVKVPEFLNWIDR
jgi:DNA-binding LytR/AlgR family response regulator